THEVAELIASSRAGVQWRALERRGREVEFHLPSPQSITGPASRDVEVGAARRRWRCRLAAWAEAATAPAAQGAARPPDPRSTAPALAARVTALEAMVERLAAQVRDLGALDRGADVFAQLLDESDDAFWSTVE